MYFKIVSIICNRLCGFANPLSFKAITEIQIDDVEKFIREDMFDYLKRKTAEEINQFDQSTLTNDEDVLISQEQLVQHFGEIYASAPEKFRFLSGDRLTIQQMVNHVKNLTEQKGIKLFKTNHKSKPKHFPSKSFDQSACNTFDALKRSLFEEITRCMKSYGADNLFDVNLDCDIHEDTVDVHNIEGVGIVGAARCVICDLENKKNKPRRIFYDQNRKYPRWVMSNYVKHLKTHNLKNQAAGIEPKLKSLTDDTEMIDKPKHNSIETVELLGDETYEEVVEDVQTESESNTDCAEILTDHSEPAEVINDIHEQLSQQIMLMMPTIVPKSNLRSMKMKFILDDIQYSIAVIKTQSDGNCLFSSLMHQLSPEEIGSESHKNSVQNLRRRVVQHILNPDNFPRYIHQIKDHVYDLKTKAEISDMDYECRSFVQSILSQDGTWGTTDSKTIQAFSEIQEVNVIIFNEMIIFMLHIGQCKIQLQ